MKKIKDPTRFILDREAISFKGLKILSGVEDIRKEDYRTDKDYEEAKERWDGLKKSDIAEDLVMDYLRVKRNIIEMLFDRIKKEADIFNQSAEIAKDMGIIQDTDGNVLKKLAFNCKEETVTLC